MAVHKRLLGLISIDSIGFGMSALCAVHCLVVPVALLFTAAGWLSFLQESAFENVMLAISMVLAIASLVPSFIREHKNIKALLVFAAGFLLIGLGRLEVNEVWEISTTTAGAALVASAHFINHRLCRCAVPLKQMPA